MFIVLIIIILVTIWVIDVEIKYRNKINNKLNEEKYVNIEKNKKIFEEKKKQYKISDDCLIIKYKKGFANIPKVKQYIWIEEKNICFFPAIIQNQESNYILYKISLEDLEYYTIQGNISKENKISGGGGKVGGSSIGGAIAGGIIAGGAGAIIGSRKKGIIEPLNSQIITHDNRETLLNYFVDGIKHSMFFDYEDYTTFLKIIPEKEYSNFVNNHLVRGSKSSIVQQLEEMAYLMEKRIITEEEFNEKKKILLDKII